MQHAPQAEHSTGWHTGWHADSHTGRHSGRHSGHRPFAHSPATPGAQAPLAAYKAQTLALLNQERAALGALLCQLRPGRPPLRPL